MNTNDVYGNIMKELNQAGILNDHPDLGRFFRPGINESIKNINKQIKENKQLYRELEKKKFSPEYEQTGIPNQSDIVILEDQGDCSMHIGYLQECLTAIFEMKIIYLFKSIETEIKQTISRAYDKVKTKNFYRWDMLLEFLKSKEITPSKLDGYQEIMELKRINNHIKHDEALSQDIKNISEFSQLERFNSISLSSFYKRVEPKVSTFLVNLSKEIYKERFEFDEDKLSKMALELVKRMDKETRLRFIDKLK